MFIKYWRLNTSATGTAGIRNLFVKKYKTCFQYQQNKFVQSLPVAGVQQYVSKKKSDDIIQPKYEHQQHIKTEFNRSVKKPARDPLAKGFFYGKADVELLAYPEAINREDMTSLCKDIDCRLQHIKETFNSETVLSGKLIDNKLFESLKHGKSFATSVPIAFGGSGYNFTQQCYSFEGEAEDLNVASMLCSHQLFTTILNNYGTDHQKNMYLPILAKGFFF